MLEYKISNEPYDLDYSKKWEDQFLQILQREYEYVNIYAVCEVCVVVKITDIIQKSFADEFSSSSTTGFVTVVLSYLAMFGYISMALGKIFPIRNKFVAVDSKFSLGLYL